MKNKAAIAVERVYDECGIDDPSQLPIETIISSKNIFLKEEVIEGSEGRIIMSEQSAIISINSKIEYLGKKRFVMAHELGHFELHRGSQKLFNDDERTLNQWYSTSFRNEEAEANEFAAEFLMPGSIFQQECAGKAFHPRTIYKLAERFQTSLTATLFRFVDIGNHPVCIFFVVDDTLKWFKPSSSWRYRLKDLTRIKVPSDSVAHEYFDKGVMYDYDDVQEVWGDTWLDDKNVGQDKMFYEYCFIAPRYNSLVSVLWED